MGNSFFAPIGFLVLCAIFIWIYAEKFSQWMIGKDNHQSLEINGSTDEIAGMAISVAGLFVVLFSIPHLVSQTWILFNSSELFENVGGEVRVFQDRIIPGLVAISMEFFFGLMLLTNTAFWVRVLKNVREYGLNENT